MTARKCPPFCIHPMTVALGAETIGETELFEFMETQLCDQGAFHPRISAGYAICYRDGMQLWELWGLTAVVPGE